MYRGIFKIAYEKYMSLWHIPEITRNNQDIFFVRHWEASNNEQWIVNWWNDDSELNEKWIAESICLWKRLAKTWVSFDTIVVSPMKRAINTAKLIADEIGFVWNIEVDKRFSEQSYWEYKWMKADDICQKFNVIYPWEIYRNNKEEPIDSYIEKVISWYDDITSRWVKKILIVAHGWTFRALNTWIIWVWKEDSFFRLPWVRNSCFLKIPSYRIENKEAKMIMYDFNRMILSLNNCPDNDTKEIALNNFVSDSILSYISLFEDSKNQFSSDVLLVLRDILNATFSLFVSFSLLEEKDFPELSYDPMIQVIDPNPVTEI